MKNLSEMKKELVGKIGDLDFLEMKIALGFISGLKGEKVMGEVVELKSVKEEAVVQTVDNNKTSVSLSDLIFNELKSVSEKNRKALYDLATEILFGEADYLSALLGDSDTDIDKAKELQELRKSRMLGYAEALCENGLLSEAEYDVLTVAIDNIKI